MSKNLMRKLFLPKNNNTMKINLKITRELKIGFFAIVILTGLFLLINYLKGRDIFGKVNIYYAVYENVEGLTTTCPVFIKGLKVGFVEKIKFAQERDRFIVALSVKSDYNIPENSTAEIFSSDIMGSKSIRIDLGDSKIYLKEKDTMGASVQVSLITMVTQELIPLKNKAEVLIESMNKTFVNINDVLDEQTKQDLSQSISELKTTISNIESITENLQKQSPKVNSIIDNISSVTNSLEDDSKNIKRGIKNIADFSDTLKSADFSGAIISLKRVLNKIEDPSGSVGKLLTTDSLHTQINNLLLELDKLVKNINENPKKYIKVSVF